jgi:putative addiction module CopG family antidote
MLMTIEIPSDLQPFIDQELKAGNYSSEQEIVSEALRMLERERTAAVEGIKAGLADVQAGRVQPLGKAFDELRRELGVKEGQ